MFSEIDAEELCKAAKVDNVSISVMVDNIDHIKLLEKYAIAKNVNFKILIEIDVSYKFLGQTIGVLRSPLKEKEEVINLVEAIEKAKNLQFRGIMGYEAQNASVGDNKFLYRWMKRKSRNYVNTKHQTIIDSLIEAGYSVEVANGGGSGCFQENSEEKVITEIGIGSLLFKSHIFDSIKSLNYFKPSLFFCVTNYKKAARQYCYRFFRRLCKFRCSESHSKTNPTSRNKNH